MGGGGGEGGEESRGKGGRGDSGPSLGATDFRARARRSTRREIVRSIYEPIKPAVVFTSRGRESGRLALAYRDGINAGHARSSAFVPLAHDLSRNRRSAPSVSLFRLPLRAMLRALARAFRRALARRETRVTRVESRTRNVIGRIVPGSGTCGLIVPRARRCRRESIVASLGLSCDGQERIDRIG